MPKKFKVRLNDGSIVDINAEDDIDMRRQIEQLQAVDPNPTPLPPFDRAEEVEPQGLPGQETDELRTISEQLQGLPFNAEELASSFAPADLATRFSVGRTNRADEAIEVIRRRFGDDTEIKVVRGPGGSPIIMARPIDQEEFQPLDIAGDFSPGDAAELFSLVASAETVGALTALTMTRGLSALPLLTRGARAARAATTSVATGAGAMLGRLGDIGIEEARGIEFDTTEEILGQLRDTGLFVTAADLSFKPLGLLGRRGQSNFVRKFFRTGIPEAEAAVFAGEIGTFFSAGDVHPILRSKVRQAGISGVRAGKRLDERQSALHRELVQFRNDLGDPDSLTLENLTELLEKQERELMESIVGPLKNDFSTLDGQNALRAYDGMKRNQLQRIYTELHNTPDVFFDLTPLDDVVSRGMRGFDVIQPPRVPGQPSIRISNMTAGSREARAEVIAFMTAVQNMSPIVEGVGVAGKQVGASGLKKMQLLRETAFNLKDDFRLPGFQRDIISDVYVELGKIMTNPKGPGATAAVRRKLLLASRRNKTRENILNRSYVQRLMNTDTPETLGAQAISPFNPELLRVLKMTSRSVSPDYFTRVSAGFVNRLRNNPLLLERLLKNPRAEKGLRILMSPEQIRSFRTYGQEARKFATMAHVKMVRRQTARGREALQLIEANDRAGLQALVQSLGGKESTGGRALAAGAIQKIYDDASAVVKGVTVVDNATVAARIKQMIDSGFADILLSSRAGAAGSREVTSQILGTDVEARRLLSPRERLRLMQVLVSFLPTGAGAGESIQVASVASNLQLTLRLDKLIGAMGTLFNNYIAGRMLIGKFSTGQLKKVIELGQAVEVTTPSNMRILAGILATVLDQARNDAAELFPEIDAAALDAAIDIFEMPDALGMEVREIPDPKEAAEENIRSLLQQGAPNEALIEQFGLQG
jgi:hypothetical protein